MKISGQVTAMREWEPLNHEIVTIRTCKESDSSIAVPLGTCRKQGYLIGDTVEIIIRRIPALEELEAEGE